MKHRHFSLLSLITAVAATTGCAADHQGYLLRADNGQRSPITFHEKSSGKRGNVEAVLASGERCEGQYNTVPDQVTRSWEDPDDIESEDTQVGMAVLSCANSRVVKCNFSKAHADGGNGQCLDTEGRKYTLNF
jgi:hypothetical protein